MALSSVELEVTGPKGASGVRLNLDSGTVYSVLPPEVWRRLGIVQDSTMIFTLPDGTMVERRMGQCQFRYCGGLRRYAPVVMGGPHDIGLLGSATLEALGLVMHPFERTLSPMRALAQVA